MMLRLSQKLSSKIEVKALRERPLEGNPYADWSCHVFTANRAQYIIATNTASLYSCLVHGKGITSDRTCIDRMFACVREFTEVDGQAFLYQKFIMASCERVTFAKPWSRSVTGSMNDLIHCAKVWLVDEELSPFDVGFKLNDMPMGALDYAKPREAFKQLATERFEKA